MIKRAFFLNPEWASLVLCGKKTWELRTKPCRFREQVGIIETGTKTVVGFVQIVASHADLTEDKLEANFPKHLTTPERSAKARRRANIQVRLGTCRCQASTNPRALPSSQWASGLGET
jgi:hypothetical protein